MEPVIRIKIELSSSGEIQTSLAGLNNPLVILGMFEAAKDAVKKQFSESERLVKPVGAIHG